MNISLKLLIYILTLLVFIQFGYLYFRSVYNTIDQENNHVLNLELPYIAVFIQIGHYNATNWNNLLDCMNSIVIAKSLSTESSVFYNLNSNHTENFHLDIHISFTNTVEFNNRMKAIFDLKALKNVNNIYTSLVKNIGLDYKPFLEQIKFSALSLNRNYDLVLKLHSKSDKKWLSHSIQCMCGTPSQVLSIIHEFKKKQNIHMITPHGLTFGVYTPLKRVFPLIVDKYYSQKPLSRAFDPRTVTRMGDLYLSLFGIPFNVARRNLRIVAGSIFWIRFKSLYPLRLITMLRTYEHNFTNGYIENHGIEHVIERFIPTIILKHGGIITEMIPAPKLMAIYFPQYHSIPENDKFWGKDFTEWSLLKPLVSNDSSEVILKPLDINEGGLGYYNLTNINTRRHQAMLAKSAGIHGFVYYHYWFSGNNDFQNHKIMFKIPELRLIDGEPDVPFMFSWANEPWSRRWNGLGKDVLIHQEYGDENDWKEHFYYLLQFFQHPSYIKIDERPVFIIYRIGHGNLVNLLKPMLQLWNELATQNGFPNGLYIVSTIGSYFLKDPKTSHMIKDIKEISATFQFFPLIRASVYQHRDRASLTDIDTIPSDTQYWGTYTSFCNKPRNPSNNCKDNSNPMKLRSWLKASFAAMQVSKWKTIQQNFFFIMAWNEWNEQAMLEPSDQYKFEYLQAVQTVLQSISSVPVL